MSKKQLAFVVEVDRCIGCKGCQVSCKQENQVPLGVDRIKVYQAGPTGVWPDLSMYFLSVNCQQCANPVCAKVCPTGAIYKNPEDGVVTLDQSKCIGCQSCNRACPYHCNTFSVSGNIMDKCNICAASREEGEEPACVRNCAGRALHYGDINDPDSEVSRLIAEAGEENVYSLQDFGNHPSARYILKNDKWLDVLPFELTEVSFRKGGRKE